jgi:anti-anti-sigma factor
MDQPQSHRAPFTIETKKGKAPGTIIFCLSGPFTAREMFGTLTPVALDNMLSFQPTPDTAPTLNILDLTGVPYMDSNGLGRIVGHYARCRGKGIRMIAAGLTPRVLDLFTMCKVDTIIPIAATVEEAEIQ